MTPEVIVRATGRGTPRWPSTHARIDGPSLSRKNVLSSAKESAKASDVSPWMPSTIPVVSAEISAGTSSCRLFDAPDAPDWSMPTLFAHDSRCATASSACWEICALCAVIPPITTTTITVASASSASNTIAAPAARGTRWRCSALTSGVATVATIIPPSTGPTIVAVVPSSHANAATSTKKPTSSHDVRPRSCSHCGAANARARRRASSAFRSGVPSVGSAMRAVRANLAATSHSSPRWDEATAPGREDDGAMLGRKTGPLADATLVAVEYPHERDAERALAVVGDLDDGDDLALHDAAIVVRHANGHVVLRQS